MVDGEDVQSLEVLPDLIGIRFQEAHHLEIAAGVVIDQALGEDALVAGVEDHRFVTLPDIEALVELVVGPANRRPVGTE